MCRPLPDGAAEGGARRIELADIVRACGERHRERHRLSGPQRRAMHAIESCRTAALGGQKHVCEACGAVRIVYHSCRNRHCPKCQTLRKERWLEARRAELLPVEYFHLVFTLPHELNVLAQGNPRVIYALLFEAAAGTLQGFARDPQWVGGEPGITAMLHTWGQNLSQHLHLHCIVTGGGLAPGGSRWIPARSGFLFPVRALSKVFRGKYLEALERGITRGRFRFAGSTASLATPRGRADWLSSLRRQDWVVYAKPSFAGPEQVLQYLGRYTHRVALTNERLLSFDAETVRFRWKDYAAGGRTKILELPAEEFLRRFLLHILPDRFVRIRHFGILANRSRRTKLARCRTLLAQPPPPSPVPGESVEALMLRLTGIDLALCPVCRRGRMRVEEILPPVPFHSTPPPPDTS